MVKRLVATHPESISQIKRQMQVPSSEKLVFPPNSPSFFSRDFLEILMLF
jgi:hypothetical protein